MATQYVEVPSNDFIQIAEGACIFQVRCGRVLVYVGSSKPPANENACFLVRDTFSYTGEDKVWVRGLDSYNAIVVDTNI